MDGLEVHIWVIPLTRELERVHRYYEMLEECERSKAGRFHFLKDRERFVIGRGSMRFILAKYLNESPEKVRFRYGSNGKPELDMGCLEPNVRFNLSHSHEIGILAVTCGRRVGVDVEKLTPHSVDEIGIAECFFSPVEIELVRSASAEMRTDVFFRIWTRKEAFLKGCGDGLSAPLDRFEVSLAEPGIRFSGLQQSKGASWSVHEFSPCAGYVAAVAIEGMFRKFELLSMECCGNGGENMIKFEKGSFLPKLNPSDI